MSNWRQRKIKQIRNHLFRRQHGQCYYCNRGMIRHIPVHHRKTENISRMITIDHVKPISKGGSKTDISNMVGACLECNGAKGDMDADEFIALVREARQKPDLLSIQPIVVSIADEHDATDQV